MRHARELGRAIGDFDGWWRRQKNDEPKKHMGKWLEEWMNGRNHTVDGYGVGFHTCLVGIWDFFFSLLILSFGVGHYGVFEIVSLYLELH
jgi:hypothetical protein